MSWVKSRVLAQAAVVGDSSSHRLPCKGDLNEGVHEVLTVTHKCFGDIRHDAGVHFGQSLCFVESHIESGPGSF